MVRASWWLFQGVFHVVVVGCLRPMFSFSAIQIPTILPWFTHFECTQELWFDLSFCEWGGLQERSHSQGGFAAVWCCCQCIQHPARRAFSYYFLKMFCQRHKSGGVICCNNLQRCVKMPWLNVVKSCQLCRVVEAQTIDQDSLITVKWLHSALKMRILPSFPGSKLGQSVPRIYISIKNHNNNTLCL